MQYLDRLIDPAMSAVRHLIINGYEVFAGEQPLLGGCFDILEDFQKKTQSAAVSCRMQPEDLCPDSERVFPRTSIPRCARGFSR